MRIHDCFFLLTAHLFGFSHSFSLLRGYPRVLMIILIVHLFELHVYDSELLYHALRHKPDIQNYEC